MTAAKALVEQWNRVICVLITRINMVEIYHPNRKALQLASSPSRLELRKHNACTLASFMIHFLFPFLPFLSSPIPCPLSHHTKSTLASLQSLCSAFPPFGSESRRSCTIEAQLHDNAPNDPLHPPYQGAAAAPVSHSSSHHTFHAPSSYHKRSELSSETHLPARTRIRAVCACAGLGELCGLLFGIVPFYSCR